MNAVEPTEAERTDEPLEVMELGSVSTETKGTLQMVTSEPSIVPFRLPWW